MTEFRTALDHALDFARRGFSVIPVPLGAKIPTMLWREFQTRHPTDAELRRWFATEHNLAVVTGAISGVVVVDADSPEAVRFLARRLPYTPWQVKTAHGFHVWYRHPGVRVANRARIETKSGRLALDVRGDGGFVIVPPSLHPSGVRYTFAGKWDAPRRCVPFFWPGWLARPMQTSRIASRPPQPRGPLAERARKYLAAVPIPEIGHGSDNDTFYAACKLVRGFGLDAATTVDLLVEWAGGRDGWTRDWIASKVESAIKYGTEPIGTLQ